MESIPPNTAGIYKITCVPTGKFYIGSSQDIAVRWRKHRERLSLEKRGSPHLQYAWNKYGADAFVIEILEPVMFIEHLLEREQFYLDTLRPYDRTIGFNIALYAGAPMRGRKTSAETLKKLADRSRGKTHSAEVRQKISAMKKGVPQTQLFTPEVNAKRAAAGRGKRHTDATRQKMAESARQRQSQPRHIVTTPEGEELLVHLSSFCREHGLSYGNMMNIVNGQQRPHHGYTARRAIAYE
jgi:group I intron endonuclease